MLTVPAASDPTESLADWMEIEALRSQERQTSVAKLTKLIRRTGSTDAIVGPLGDAGSVASQSVAQEAFAEIENRKKACGPSRYPFDVENGFLKVQPSPEDSPYIWLLLMSVVPPTAGHNGTAALFERLCTRATLGYLGGTANGVTAIRFGSPRRPPLAKLSQAIDDLCKSLREGGRCRSPEKAKHTGDEGLDIVAWRHFPDAKEGKLIAFGQCAAGLVGWQSKLAEMDARAFMKKWLFGTLVVDPVRLFFVPRRIPADDWEHAGIDGGVLFDRCRIVACLNEPDDQLTQQCVALAKALLKRL